MTELLFLLSQVLKQVRSIPDVATLALYVLFIDSEEVVLLMTVFVDF